VTSFFAMLRAELAFYLGCVNLHAWLTEHRLPVCFPEPLDAGDADLTATDVFDPCLAIQMQRSVVPNDVDTNGRPLVVVTGANQGGKSTLLRSIGLGLLMMQSGMMVCASSFRAGVCTGLFTHYKREEDDTMESGKLDEELARMSEIADAIRPHCVVLCNESFASTNEQEGSEIARQVVRALLRKQIRVLFVTHMFDLAHGFESDADRVCFLRAERGSDGERTFKIRPGRPLSTSYGGDTYRQVFGEDAVATGKSA
jgi:DNA mismatch repair ATPase MutS